MATDPTFDIVIIGAGLNGLVAGIYLARSGRKVVILERNPVPGGAMQTAEVTLPGYRHDLFATNLSLFAGSAFHREFAADLARHGLEFTSAKHTFSSVFPDGTWLGVSTDIDETVRTLDAVCAEDGRRWRAMHRDFPDRAELLIGLLNEPAPSIGMARVLLRHLRRHGWRRLQEMAELLLSSPRDFAEANFKDPRTRALAAAWGMHLDFGPDIAGGAMFPYLECMANQSFGMVLGRGGAAAGVNAMVGLFKELGGELRCGAEVAAVDCVNGAAAGVTLTSGESIAARSAVIANLSPRPLFNGLVGRDNLPAHFLQKLDRYRYGPGTMMIHIAADGLPDWNAGADLRNYAYVHIGPYMEDMARTYSDSLAGILPAEPTLVVAQPSVIDPSRAPEGMHVISIQVRTLPPVIRGDALERIRGRDWHEIKEAYADRVVAKVESYAAGFKGTIVRRTVLSPADLEAANPSLVGGCSLAGSMHLRQNFLLRPFAGWSRYRTPVKNLYMTGAATWPGAGTGAGSGRLLAKQLGAG